MGESFLVNSVYRSCMVTVNSKDSRVDLIVLSLVDFNVILRMEWLASCHAIVDCHQETVQFTM